MHVPSTTEFPSDKWEGTCHPPSPLYISRAAALAAGIPATVPIETVNRLCSSGLMAIRHIAHSIQTGETTFGLAIGMESMSQKYGLVQLKHICADSLPSPRPTPEVCEAVSQNVQAHDCIQVHHITSQLNRH